MQFRSHTRTWTTLSHPIAQDHAEKSGRSRVPPMLQSDCAARFRRCARVEVGRATEIGGLRITAMGARHWGRRWPWGTDYGFNSYLLEKDGYRMLLGCDSAYTDLFASLRANPPEVRGFRSERMTPGSEPGQSRAGLVDVPADRRAIPRSDSLGHVQAIAGADGGAAATSDCRRRQRGRPSRDEADWRRVDGPSRPGAAGAGLGVGARDFTLTRPLTWALTALGRAPEYPDWSRTSHVATR